MNVRNSNTFFNTEYRNALIVTGVSLTTSFLLAVGSYLATSQRLSTGLGIASLIIGLGGFTEGTLRFADAVHVESMKRAKP